MTYDLLRTLAWQLNPDIKDLPFEHETMAFPEEWRYELLQISASAQKRDVAITSLPLKALNQLLRTLVPELIAISPNAARADADVWLRGTECAITPDALQLLMYQWAKRSFSKVPSDSLERVAQQLTPGHLVWTPKTLNLAAWHTHANGTAKPKDRAVFNVLPDLIASRLCRKNVVFDLRGKPLRFVRSPISPGSSGTEMISWPPYSYEQGKKRYYYSILAKITLQTTPFQPTPQIYIDLGVRRWVSEPIKRLPKKRTSVYLRAEVPWINGIHQSNSFQAAAVRWSGRESGYVWDNDLAEILNQLTSHNPLPSPQAIVEDPAAMLNPDGTPNVAMVYRNAMSAVHRVAPGLMPVDRKPLFEQFSAVLAPEFVLSALLPRTGKRRRNAPPSGAQTKADALADSLSNVGESIAYEIYYQREETCTAFLLDIGTQLGVSIPPELPATISLAHLTLTVDAHLVGKLGSGLSVESAQAGGNASENERSAANQRIAEIRTVLQPTTTPTVAFVEIEDAAAFEYRIDEFDPKKAIRAGFAQTGRLSQFVNVQSDSSHRERTKRAVLDGFRQLGVHRIPSSHPTVEPMNCAGVWMIQRSSGRYKENIPLFVLINAYNGAVLAKAPGFDAWLPYHQALLKIGQNEYHGFEDTDKTVRYIQQVIRDQISPEGDAVLLCHSQNLRRVWKWLADAEISLDSLRFGQEVPTPITEWPGLRVVRVRDSAGSETPEWYAVRDERFGFSKGLFRINERVFASTYGKPSQFKKSSVKVSIVTNPQMAVWNPALCELTVAALQPGDDPVEIADMVHSLRLASIQYDEATSLPLPLHLAKLMAEYAMLPTDEEDGAIET